jgi:hypothetical protein
MRRIDVLWIGAGLIVAGIGFYALFSAFGLSAISAGIWSQLLFLMGLIAWIGTYVFRVTGRKMTYNTQMRDYKLAVLQKQREEKAAKEASEKKP